MFDLPASTIINKVVPKNAFDTYTNSRQKKMFADLVLRIRWTNKLSAKTINLSGKKISEIQIFCIELKQRCKINVLLEIIDKAIPYPIIFKVTFGDEMFLSVSAKHPHPLNSDNAVIDYTFTTDWFEKTGNPFVLNLKRSLDAVFHDICVQISGKFDYSALTTIQLIEHCRQISELEKEMSRLKSEISSSIQFNKMVSLNLQLKAKEKALKDLIL
jgi:hypothetical protein